jgi:hypothetical protein
MAARRVLSRSTSIWVVFGVCRDRVPTSLCNSVTATNGTILQKNMVSSGMRRLSQCMERAANCLKNRRIVAYHAFHKLNTERNRLRNNLVHRSMRQMIWVEVLVWARLGRVLAWRE